jgi:2',3'-cyclic-nucleotide 2'-phosphodiesterase
LKLLFIGDIFGHAGRAIVADHLADIRTTQAIDVVIANGENSAAGFGITPNVAEELFRYGIDVMTSGNHIWDKRDIYEYFTRNPRLLRPANYPQGCPGAGVYIHETAAGARCAVINLQGRRPIVRSAKRTKSWRPCPRMSKSGSSISMPK